MKILDFNTEYRGKISLALGFFDSVHRGHRALITKTADHALTCGIQSAVFTFGGNLYKAFSDDFGQIYNFEERKDIIKSLGIDLIIKAEPSKDFLNLSPLDFLNVLTESYNVDIVFCGEDFRFGEKAEGNIAFLRKYLESKDIDLVVFDMVKENGIKISTGDIRNLLMKGDVKTADYYLGSPFSITGEVIKGRGKGRFIGFPTANLSYPVEKIRLKDGVYATVVIFDGIPYKSITNVGGKPTFDDNTFGIESFIFNYSGKELYGHNIKVLFYERIRDVVKYQNIEELSLQIKSDIKKSKDILGKLL